MKKAIVSGATGFLGAALTKELLNQGVTVYGIGTNARKLDTLSQLGDLTPIQLKFPQYGNLPNLIHERDIDLFYHFAWTGGFTSAIKDYRIQLQNASYAGDALMAASEMNVKRFVYANTYNQFEIAHFLDTDLFEPRPTCIYAAGKTAGHLICQTLAQGTGIEYCDGLVPMPFGVENYSKQLINVVLDNLNKGIPPKLVEGNNLYDIVHVDEIAKAFVAIGEHGVNRRGYYIGHRELKTFREWMENIRDVVAPSVALRFGEYKDNQQIDYSTIDLDALYRDTGFDCSEDFEQRIMEAAEWVKEHTDLIH